MPLTAKGREVMAAMKEQYGEEEGERVFYASKNAGKITGVDTKAKDAEIGGDPGPVKVVAGERPTPPSAGTTTGINPEPPGVRKETGIPTSPPAIDRRGPRPPDVQVGSVRDYARSAGAKV
jgi:hypothetical protein